MFQRVPAPHDSGCHREAGRWPTSKHGDKSRVLFGSTLWKTILKTPIFEFQFPEKSNSPVSGLPSRCPYASLRVLGLKSWANLLRRVQEIPGCFPERYPICSHIKFLGQNRSCIGMHYPYSTHIFPLCLLMATIDQVLSYPSAYFDDLIRIVTSPKQHGSVVLEILQISQEGLHFQTRTHLELRTAPNISG